MSATVKVFPQAKSLSLHKSESKPFRCMNNRPFSGSISSVRLASTLSLGRPKDEPMVVVTSVHPLMISSHRACPRMSSSFGYRREKGAPSAPPSFPT
ncbi:unnamed protein product [Pseudo-nitzschia multistriata]|uniref:Uncharacterized protein n=1 Tax=Pseudo-nitzschia multistriata TaxID=183589 RepID=A0A448ZFN3_9STRA|nr:unnamed protein product [Pseudo-nitzschia multistriata]